MPLQNEHGSINPVFQAQYLLCLALGLGFGIFPLREGMGGSHMHRTVPTQALLATLSCSSAGMFRTVVNIWGDACAVTCVDAWANNYENKGMKLDEAALAAGPHESFMRGHDHGTSKDDAPDPKLDLGDSAHEGTPLAVLLA